MPSNAATASVSTLEKVIEILVRDLKEAETTISALMRENSHLKDNIRSFESHQWIFKPRPKNHAPREITETKPRPNCKEYIRKEVNSFNVNTSNRFEALANEVNKDCQTDHSVKKEDRSKNKKYQRNKIFLLTDSHGRGIARNVHSDVGHKFEVSGMVKPGAKIDNVLHNCDNVNSEMSENDFVVIIGGTNDVSRNEANNVTKCPIANILIADLPIRHDLSNNSIVNQEIVRINKRIKKIAQLHNASLLETSQIQRTFFTRHGQHLNAQGKKVLGNIITRAILGISKREKKENRVISLPYYEKETHNSTEPGPNNSSELGPHSTSEPVHSRTLELGPNRTSDPEPRETPVPGPSCSSSEP